MGDATIGASLEQRLRALRATRLLDSPADPSFDRLTRLASRLLEAPVSLISLVDEHRQFFKSAVGLAEPWASQRETPLSHSFCQEVTRSDALVVVTDARADPRFRDNLAIRDLHVIAYAGYPLRVDGTAIGAFCVIDDKPRTWSDADLALLGDLAGSVVTEIELLAALAEAREQRVLLASLVDAVGDGVLAVGVDRRILVVNPAARALFDGRPVLGGEVSSDWTAVHGSRRPDGTALTAEEGAIARALRGEPTDGLRFSIARAGAPAIWVEASGRPVPGDDGAVFAAIAIYRDVTEEKRQSDLYRALVGNIPRSAVLLFDREQRCVAVEGQLVRQDAIDPRGMIGKTMRELAPPDAQARFTPVDDMYRRTLEGATLSMEFESGGRTLALHTAPVRDAEGAITGGLVLAIDRSAEHEIERALALSEQQTRAIIEHLPGGAVLMVDRDLRYVAADGPILSDVLRDAQLEQLIGRTVDEVSAPEHRERNVSIYRRALAGESVRVEIERGERVLDLHAVPVRDGDRISHALVFFYDVTERKRAAALLGATLEHIQDGVALLDGQRRILLANPAYAAMFALPAERVVGMSRPEFLARVAPLAADPDGFVALLEQLAPDQVTEVALVRPRPRWLRRTWTALDGADGRFLVSWQDITAEKELLAERERLPLIDPLTGAANRRAAEQALALETARMRRAGTPLAVAMFDVDHFKQVNDRHGHAAGDEVLRGIASALRSEARATDLVARWGGEEFLAILPGSSEGARAFCERARAAIAGTTFPAVGRVTISAGVAALEADDTAEAAIARADTQLYRAKRDGRDRVCG